MNALLIVCGLGFISLVAEIINLKKGLHIAIILGLIVAVATVISDWNTSATFFNKMLVFDPFSVAFTSLIIVVGIFWFCLASPFFIGESHQTDRTALTVFTMVGGIMMVSFHNMAILFLGIEILSISLYVLAGSHKESFFSNEAAFKYFIMGSFATGFLLMGIALVYGATGSFDTSEITMHIEAHKAGLPGFFYVGIFLMLVGLAFKISVVPFHFWAPDVYAGSPTMITAFMSTVVKIAAVGAFYKIFGLCFFSVQMSVLPIIQGIIILTLLVANIIAVCQNNVKRMLAYSSIAHVGYMLLGFISGNVKYEGILFFYLASYATTSLIAFGILYAIENAKGSTSIDAVKGLYNQNPFAATCMTIALLSLAGIPPFAGFFSKYLIFGSAIEADHIMLVIVAVVTSLVGVYYYFRPIIYMFSPSQDGDKLYLSAVQKAFLGLLTVAALLLGLLPEWIITMLG
jgi:NADH-quinone oxidoreductase subunit N